MTRMHRLAHLFGAHDHDEARKVDRALETSSDGIRAVKFSLAVLLLTAILQAAVVALSDSVALLSDTLHNVADALTALPLWFAFSLGRRSANRRYTYGYGRAEDLAGIFIVVVIAVSLFVAAYESIARLISPRELENLPLVAIASVIGFAGNEAVALYRIRAGRRIGSAALVADGLHARSDALTSLAVLAGAVGVWLGFPVADPIAGLAISVVLLFVLLSAARDVYWRLMDAVDPGLVSAIEEVLRKVAGVVDVGPVRVRWVGHRLFAEVTVIVEGDLTVVEAHDISVAAHHGLLHDVPRLSSATVHVDPVAAEGTDHHGPLAHHFPRRGRNQL